MGKKNNVEETPQQRALAEVATATMQRWQQKSLPLMKNFMARVDSANAPDSAERRRASGMATTDTAARFAQAGRQADTAAAATGRLGSSGQKLAIAGMGDDQATSSGMGKVRADSANDDAFISGLSTITALGKGEKATAVNGLAQSAAMSGQQAAADAEDSLQRQAGWGSLAGSVAGTAWGLRGSRPPPSLDDPRAPVRGQLGYGG